MILQGGYRLVNEVSTWTMNLCQEWLNVLVVFGYTQNFSSYLSY